MAWKIFSARGDDKKVTPATPRRYLPASAQLFIYGVILTGISYPFIKTYNNWDRAKMEATERTRKQAAIAAEAAKVEQHKADVETARQYLPVHFGKQADLFAKVQEGEKVVFIIPAPDKRRLFVTMEPNATTHTPGAKYLPGAITDRLNAFCYLTDDTGYKPVKIWVDYESKRNGDSGEAHATGCLKPDGIVFDGFTMKRPAAVRANPPGGEQLKQ
jgi:hypothetical protein